MDKSEGAPDAHAAPLRAGDLRTRFLLTIGCSDLAAEPIYRETMHEIIHALAREGSSKSYLRKLGLAQTFFVAGRASEGAWLSWNGLTWDAHFNCLVVEVPQSKVAKEKLVALVPGASRHDDWFLAFGDYMVVVHDAVYDPDGHNFLIPEIARLQRPGSTLGDWLRDLLPVSEGGTGSYVLVPSLPARPTAGGMRPAVCNMLAAKMPPEFVIHTTGHHMEKISALYEYLDPSRALCMAGMRVSSAVSVGSGIRDPGSGRCGNEES